MSAASWRVDKERTFFMVSRTAGAVKELRTPKRYFVPGIPSGKRQRTAGIGHFDTHVFRSLRSSRGRRYDGDSLNILQSILDEIERDGLSLIEVVICYRRNHINVIYGTSAETMRTCGQLEYLGGAWQYSLPREYWSINGAMPERQLPQQMGLF